MFCAFEQKNQNKQGTKEENYQKLIMLNEDNYEEMFNIEIKKNSVPDYIEPQQHQAPQALSCSNI